jgi:hypothetical protein
MILHTASEGITFAKKLEDDSAKFYEELARLYTKGADGFLTFAKENKKNITQVERAYYGVITDAIEGCFAFNIDQDEYTLDTTIPEGADYASLIDRSIKLEEKIIKFYTDAAEQSRSLMAYVPRAFSLIARKRAERISKLKDM